MSVKCAGMSSITMNDLCAIEDNDVDMEGADDIDEARLLEEDVETTDFLNQLAGDREVASHREADDIPMPINCSLSEVDMAFDAVLKNEAICDNVAGDQMISNTVSEYHTVSGMPCAYESEITTISDSSTDYETIKETIDNLTVIVSTQNDDGAMPYPEMAPESAHCELATEAAPPSTDDINTQEINVSVEDEEIDDELEILDVANVSASENIVDTDDAIETDNLPGSAESSETVDVLETQRVVFTHDEPSCSSSMQSEEALFETSDHNALSSKENSSYFTKEEVSSANDEREENGVDQEVVEKSIEKCADAEKEETSSDPTTLETSQEVLDDKPESRNSQDTTDLLFGDALVCDPNVLVQATKPTREADAPVLTSVQSTTERTNTLCSMQEDDVVLLSDDEGDSQKSPVPTPTAPVKVPRRHVARHRKIRMAASMLLRRKRPDDICLVSAIDAITRTQVALKGNMMEVSSIAAELTTYVQRTKSIEAENLELLKQMKSLNMHATKQNKVIEQQKETIQSLTMKNRNLLLSLPSNPMQKFAPSSPHTLPSTKDNLATPNDNMLARRAHQRRSLTPAQTTYPVAVLQPPGPVASSSNSTDTGRIRFISTPRNVLSSSANSRANRSDRISTDSFTQATSSASSMGNLRTGRIECILLKTVCSETMNRARQWEQPIHPMDIRRYVSKGFRVVSIMITSVYDEDFRRSRRLHGKIMYPRKSGALNLFYTIPTRNKDWIRSPTHQCDDEKGMSKFCVEVAKDVNLMTSESIFLTAWVNFGGSDQFVSGISRFDLKETPSIVVKHNGSKRDFINVE